jgi:selenocysteine-specific elongation factor
MGEVARRGFSGFFIFMALGAKLASPGRCPAYNDGCRQCLGVKQSTSNAREGLFMAVSRIVGIAGPVGDGKTALVQALTGIAGDRVPDEKRRRGTIDLNFAVLDLEDLRLGIIDLPGDPRFLKNMLAGATGLDGAILVIAADQPGSPWSCEHLDLLQLLGLRSGVIVLSRCDLIAAAQADRVAADVRQLVSRTFLADAPIVHTSARTGAGIDELKSALAVACRQVPLALDPGWFRMPIDRAIVIPDTGIVVTGSVRSGIVRVGDELELLPGKMQVRVRSIQNHNRAVDEACRGQRAALNLDGGVGVADIKRGQELARPGYLVPSSTLTVRLQCMGGVKQWIAHDARVHFHAGTTAVVGKVALLDCQSIEPGRLGLGQAFLDEPITTVWGQPFVIRDLQTGIVLGGGRILQPVARKVRRRNVKLVECLDSLGSDDMELRCLTAALLSGPAGIVPADLVRDAGVAPDEAAALLERLRVRGDLVAVTQGPGGPEALVHVSAIRPVEDRLQQSGIAGPLLPRSIS